MNKNTHLEHPEDLILGGFVSVLFLLYNEFNVSLKIDGSPAIVWGTDPATGTFFVGTKSVFNKRKIKIPHSHEEIDQHYKMPLSDILHACFDYLPRTEGIYQGDFIGFGGTDTYTPNTLTYKFPEVINQNIIVAPHTEYTAENDLRDAVAKPLQEHFVDSDEIKWVQPCVDLVRENDVSPPVPFTKNFFHGSEYAKIKKDINTLIKNDIPLSDGVLTDILGDNQLTNLFQLITEVKEDLMNSFIIYDAPQVFLNGQPTQHEGFVIWSEYGQCKLVNRSEFSRANFARGAVWDS